MNHPGPKRHLSLLPLFLMLFLQGLSLFAVEDVGKVWFSPNKGGDDFLNLFTDQNSWNNARDNVDVFQFFYQNLIDDNPALCAPRCGNVVYPNLVAAGAFTKLNEWDKDIAVLVPVIKEWPGGCTAARPIEITLRAMDRVVAQNEQVDFLTMDEPFNDGRTGCQRTGAEGRRASVEQTVDYIAGVRARYPNVKVGDTEPFPVNSAQDIIVWIDELQNRLRERGQPALAFFRLDVNRAYTGVNYQQGIAQIKAHCALRNIPFSIIYWGDLLNFTPVTNQEYYSNTLNWVNWVKTNSVAGDHHVFNSWHVDDQGVSRVPINLPENDPSIFSHTRLMREGLAVLLDNNAQFVSQQVPTVMDAGRDYPVSVTFRNNGLEAWVQQRNYKLGSQNPQDNSIWGFGRVAMENGEVVLPGANKTFSFTVRAPTSPGSYNFQWKMNHEAIEWFGAPSNNVVVNVRSAPSTYQLTVVNGSGSGSYVAGTVVNISANAPPSGQEFDRWVGAAVANATSANTTLAMPSAATTVTATYRDLPPSGVSSVGSGAFGLFNKVFWPGRGERLDVRYNVMRSGRVKLVVYNKAGEQIRELYHGQQGAGSHNLYWDGMDDSGQPVPSGLLFLIYEQEGDQKPSRTKIVILK